MNQRKLQTLIVFLFLGTGLAGAQADVLWSAYNDLNVIDLHQTHENVTDYTNYDSETNNSGLLKNFETGSYIGTPHVEIIGNAGTSNSDDTGGNLVFGTPAYNIFNDIATGESIVDFEGRVNDIEDSQFQDIVFTGLDPTKTYTFAGTSVRSRIYSDRITRVTISGHDSAVNNSSLAYAPNPGDDYADYGPADNSSTGYVASWTDIEPGADGSFTIRSEIAGIDDKTYPICGFRLQELGPVGNQPPSVNAGTDQDITLPIHSITLNATVTDVDGLGDPDGYLAMQWSKVSGPGEVTFDPPEANVEDPTVGFALDAPGIYVLKLEATDGELSDFDEVSITVNPPDCPIGDLNGDCIVDGRDLQILKLQWLTNPGEEADINSDNYVDGEDYNWLVGNWLENWQTSSLQVFIEPAAVRGAGQWRRIGQVMWHNHGEIESGLSIGSHTIEFSTVSDWDKPENKDVDVVYGEIAQASGTYDPHTGSLQVNISPPDVLPDAKWRRVGQSVWRDSGTTETDIPVGPHSVEFTAVSGWMSPGNRDVSIDQLPPNPPTVLDVDYEPQAAVTLRINEFMAANSSGSGITDEHLDADDWIEIYNATDSPVDIGGMWIEDEQDKWQIPTGYSGQTTITGFGYLVIWADAEGALPVEEGEGVLHLGLIQLDADGDEITLYNADGVTVIDSVVFDDQVTNVSYGRYPDGENTWYYFTNPTKGTPNDPSGLADQVADTKFSPDRGFYTSPFYVTITTATPGATIYFTTDDTWPIDSNWNPTGTAQTYDEVTNKPYITTTTNLRAVAVKDGNLPTNIDTQTYIFLNDVLNQPTNPAGYPSQWISGNDVITGDYQVDPDIVNNFNPANNLTVADMQAVPTIVVSMPKDDWFQTGHGLYVTESLDGMEYVCSFEYFDPEGSGLNLQQNCAMAMQGGISDGGTSLGRWKTPKLSNRPRFKTQTDNGTSTGGPSKLRAEIFPDSPVKDFDTVVLDGVLNHSWLHSDFNQRNTVKYVQDQGVADLHNAMLPGHSPHGSYAHVYINTLYWGMYYIHERPDHSWAAETFGGEKEEYDAVKHGNDDVTGDDIINDGVGGDSITVNWNTMKSAADNATTNPADPDYLSDWQLVESHLDIDNLITYLLSHWFAPVDDWPDKNWYATHREGGQWRFHTWDAEHSFEGTNRVGACPHDIHSSMSSHPEYKMRWADHIHKHFHHDGVLSYPQAKDLYQTRVTQADQAIRGESARWGDYRQPTSPHTRSQWLGVDTQDGSYFTNRSSTVEGWLSGLYPTTEPPDFRINGSPMYGGYVFSGNTLTMTNPNGSGTIYYTLNGNDPRLPGGAVNTAGGASAYGPVIPLTHSIRVKARVLNGGEWSALSDAVFALSGVKENLRITELMFHPLDPPAGNADAEFIELKNISTTDTINLNLVSFTNGVDLELPYLQLGPGAITVVIKDLTAFESQYSTGGITIVPDVYTGSLDNGGERIELVDALGQPIHNFRYDDDWYLGTDGEGLSLNIRDPYNINLNDWDQRGGWKASSVFKGTPGLDDEGVGQGDVVINEVLSHSSGGLDWIELRNLSEEDLDLDGMYLSNSDADDPNLRKFRIPDDTTIYHMGALANGDYLVFDENEVGFTLSENGDEVYLSQEVGGVLTILADEDFGASESNVAFGRYVKSELDGGVNFVAMNSNTPGEENDDPKVGPVIINEIAYNPESNGDAEYVELLNISGFPFTLYDFTTSEPWRFVDHSDPDERGIEFKILDGGSQVTLDALGPGSYLLLVKDETAFTSVYGSPPSGVTVLDWDSVGFTGNLNNGDNDRPELQMPGDLDGSERQYIRVDRVNYSDGSHPEGDDPWPTEPDDSDTYTLQRRYATQYGNDVINWDWDPYPTATPGVANPTP
jgi:lamin tail-like protein/CotH protein/K319-like protein/chitobiase/beta-hexosaminidase-like protein